MSSVGGVYHMKYFYVLTVRKNTRPKAQYIKNQTTVLCAENAKNKLSRAEGYTMSWLNRLKRKYISDYNYSILEHTPFLHDVETLERMYKNATHEQKASIMLHIDNFSDVTHDWDEYQKISNKIWDDYR